MTRKVICFKFCFPETIINPMDAISTIICPTLFVSKRAEPKARNKIKPDTIAMKLRTTICTNPRIICSKMTLNIFEMGLFELELDEVGVKVLDLLLTITAVPIKLRQETKSSRGATAIAKAKRGIFISNMSKYRNEAIKKDCTK